MKVQLPKVNNEESTIENKRSIVFVGANGAGKTRLSIWVENNNNDLVVHRISAQKSLTMPKSTSPAEMESAEELFLYGTTNNNKNWLKVTGKKNSRWGDEPEVHLLNDFPMLMQYLVTEDYQKSIEFRRKHNEGDSQFSNRTKFEDVIEIWEKVISNHKLHIDAGKVETSLNGTNLLYSGSSMSDGEREIFYFIAEAICAPSRSLIIIDEPENHLHKAVLTRLWNEIELKRQDCCFLYITHDIDFALSRTDSQIVWVKAMPALNQWDYLLLDPDNEEGINSLYLQVIGSREKVLFVEGKPDRSFDIRIYSLIFKNYNVIPLSSCTEVIRATKAFRDARLRKLIYIDVYGLIDKDRRTNSEVADLREKGIYCTSVAEVENLYLLPDVIKIVADDLHLDNGESIFAQVKEAILGLVRNDISEQAMLFTKHEVESRINASIADASGSIDEFTGCLTTLNDNIQPLEIYNKYRNKFEKMCDEKDYIGILENLNQKGMLAKSKVSSHFKWKRNDYINYVCRVLKDNSGNNSQKMHDAIKAYIPVPEI